ASDPSRRRGRARRQADEAPARVRGAASRAARGHDRRARRGGRARIRLRSAALHTAAHVPHPARSRRSPLPAFPRAPPPSPAARGAKLGRPEAPVVAIHGDGGFLMNAQDLETAVRHEIHAVTLVMNNNCWGSEKAYQKAFYNERYIGCDIGNPRYDEYARLFGGAGYYVEHPDQVADTMKAALAAGKPAIVEIPIDPNEFPTPATQARRR